MSVLDPSAQPRRLQARSRGRSALTALGAILSRDLLVSRREIAGFLVQTLVQPLFFLFVFGKVLTAIGSTNPQFSATLLPGIVALTVFMTPLQNIAIDIGRDLGFTREIDDRLLAPLPIGLVAIEKVFLAMLRGLVAGALVFPLAYLVLGSGYHMRSDMIPLLIVLMVFTSLLGTAIGLTLGTVLPIQHLGLVFAVLITPLIFSGCVFYPWATLGTIRWFQVVTLFNPLTYASEAMRYAMVPLSGGPVPGTLAIGWALFILVTSFAICISLGLTIFRRRVLS